MKHGPKLNVEAAEAVDGRAGAAAVMAAAGAATEAAVVGAVAVVAVVVIAVTAAGIVATEAIAGKWKWTSFNSGRFFCFATSKAVLPSRVVKCLSSELLV